MNSYEGGTSANILDPCTNMSESSTGWVCHMTLPRNNFSDNGDL